MDCILDTAFESMLNAQLWHCAMAMRIALRKHMLKCSEAKGQDAQTLIGSDQHCDRERVSRA